MIGVVALVRRCIARQSVRCPLRDLTALELTCRGTLHVPMRLDAARLHGIALTEGDR